MLIIPLKDHSLLFLVCPRWLLGFLILNQHIEPITEAEPQHIFMQQLNVSAGLYLLVVEEGAIGGSQVEDVGFDVLAVVPEGVHL